MRACVDIWPIIVDLHEDESFASWFCRAAWAFGLNAADLYAAMLPGARLFRRDLDRSPEPALIAALVDAARISEGRLSAAASSRWAGKIYGEDDGTGKLIWLPSPGVGLHGAGFGQQVCPDCLAEAPYLRRTWRLGFVHSCPLHGRLLLDRCPSCGAPIQPAASADIGRFDRCALCDGTLTAPADPTIFEDMAFQHRLVAVAEGAPVELGAAGPIHPVLYFRVLHVVFRLLATGRFALKLRRALRTTSADTPESIPQIKEVERLNPRCRRALMRPLSAMVTDWPDPFIAACQTAGVHARVIVKDPKSLPFALWHPVSTRLSDPPTTVDAEDVAWAKKHLRAKGLQATYAELRRFFGVKFKAQRGLADPARPHAPYGTHRYWKLDGVSPTIRVAAKNAARRNGEPVGAWVDRALRQALTPHKPTGRA